MNLSILCFRAMTQVLVIGAFSFVFCDIFVNDVKLGYGVHDWW